MAHTLFGPCAKRRTQAVLECTNGKVYVGENVCLNPQDVCPREPGEGYAKCKSICQQVDHAEIQVLAAAGGDAKGGRLTLSHWYACDPCADACRRAGVEDIRFTSPQNSERTPCAS